MRSPNRERLTLAAALLLVCSPLLAANRIANPTVASVTREHARLGRALALAPASSEVGAQHGDRFRDPLLLTRGASRVALRPIDGASRAGHRTDGSYAWQSGFRDVDVFRPASGGSAFEVLVARDREALSAIAYGVADFHSFDAVVRDGRSARFIAKGQGMSRDLLLSAPLVIDADGRRVDRAWWAIENGSRNTATIRLVVDDGALRFPVVVAWTPSTPEGASALVAAASRPVPKRPATSATGSMSGTVTEAGTGSPLAAIAVDIYYDSGEFAATANTDANGGYTVPDLEAGSYRAIVSAFGYSPELYDEIGCAASCDVTTGTPINVVAGTNTPSIDFTLGGSSSRIRGTVRSSTLDPLQVSVAAHDASGAIVSATDSNETGAYELELPAAGTYYVRTLNNQYPGHVDQLYAGIACSGCDVTTGTPIAVGSGAVVSNIDLTLDPNGGVIGGVVTGGITPAAISNAEITVFTAAGALVTFGYTDASGGYTTFHGLAAGSYYAVARAFGYQSEVFDDQPCGAACVPASGTPIAVTSGATSTADFVLANDVARVSGRVSDSSTDAPLGGVYVYFYDASGSPVLAAVSSYEDGTYSIALPEPGTYFARTFNHVHEGYGDQLYANVNCTTCAVTSGTPITVAIDAVSTGIDFALNQSGGWITGRILNADAQPIAGSYAIIYSGDGSFVTYGLADANGDYEIVSRLESGTYYVVASAAQHSSELYDGISCATGCDPVTGTPIAVVTGEATADIDFFLTTTGCPSGEIAPDTLPGGEIGEPYSEIVTPSGLTAPVTLSLIDGSLPPGVSFNTSTGAISGTLTSAGSFSFVIRGEGADGCSAARGYTIDVEGEPTTTVVSASPMSAQFGAPITLTATVLPSDATGQVDFLIDGMLVGSSSIVGGSVAIVTTSLTLGPHDVVASYRGGGVYEPSSSEVLTITVARGVPSITWNEPAPIVYGTPLTALQLNASALFIDEEGEERGVTGSFVYSPPAGTILGGGTHVLSVTFTADDTVSYDPVVATVTLVVEKGAQSISWNPPASITYGVPLSATQLNATVSVSGPAAPGALSYSPAAGAILGAGTHTLTVTAAETADYDESTASVSIVVAKAEQAIAWPAPADIVYGTPLSAAQLNATVTVVGPSPAGQLTYAPTAGTILNAGVHTLTVDAASTADYNPASASVSINVLKATPVFSNLSAPTITIATPGVSLGGSIAAGGLIPPGSVTITLGSVSQNAPIGVDGSFAVLFDSSALAAGAHVVTFSYAGDMNFTSASGSSVLTVTYGITGGLQSPNPSNAGASIPMRIQIVDALGTNRSSFSITLTPYGIRPIAGGAWTPVGDAFQFQKAQGGSYVYTLKTAKTLVPGTYEFGFLVSGDPVVHTIVFVIR